MTPPWQYRQLAAGPTIRREWCIVGAILLVGLALRGIYLAEIITAPEFTQPAVDAEFHHYWARALATGDWTPPHGQPDPNVRTTPFLRPPGYPYFLALVFTIAGPGYLAPRLVQIGLGLLNGWLAYRLARKWQGPGVGLICAALMAVDWIFIYFESRFLEPVLLITTLLSATLLLARWIQLSAVRRAMAAGVLLGLAATVRPNALLLIPAAAAWMIGCAGKETPRRTSLVHATALVLGGLLSIAPVTLRNYFTAQDWVLISSNAGVNLTIGNHEQADGLFTGELEGIGDFGTCYDYPRLVGKLERQLGRPMKHSQVSSYFTRQALSFMTAHPGETAELTARKALQFWAPYEISHNSVVTYDRQFSKVLNLLPFGFSFVSGTFFLGVLAYGFHAKNPMEANSRRKSPLKKLSSLKNSNPVVNSPPASSDGETRTAIPPLYSGGAGGVPLAGSGHRAGLMGPMTGPDQHRFAALILAFVLTYFLSFLPFFNASLYRVPIIPFLMLFAAYGLWHLWRCLCAREYRSVCIWVLVWSVSWAACAVPWIPYQPDLGEWHFNRGVAFDRQGNSQRALDHLTEAKRLRPNDVQTRCGLANALLHAGRPEEAVAEWQAALVCDPSNVTVRHDLGNALLRLGRNDEAMSVYAAAVQLGSDYAAPYFNLANLLAAGGEFDRAISLFESGLHVEPHAYQGHLGLGVALARVGRLDLAVQHCRQAVDLRPDSAEAHLNLGVLLKEQGRTQEAVGHYQEALRLVPRNPHACHNLGVAFQDLGRYEEAAENYEKALSLDRGLALSRRNLGQVLLIVNRPADALPHLQEACAQLPQDAPAFRDRGIALLRLNRTDEGIQELARAVTLDPADVAARLTLAAAYQATGRSDDAVEQFRAVLDLDPNNFEAKAQLDALVNH